MWAGYKFAIDPESNSLYAAQITSSNYLSGITSSDYFRISQQVFLVSSLTDLDNVSTSGAGLYIDYNGESQYFDGSKWIDTSHEVVTELTSSATNDTLPTTKAVYDYINTEILKIQTGNGDITDLLDGKAGVAYVNEQDKNVLSSAQAYTNIQVSGKANKSDIIGLASENYVLSSINNALTSSIKAMGTVSTSADLPDSAVINDLYFVGPINNQYIEYIRTNAGWEEFGTVNDIDLSNYVTYSYVDEQISGKIDKSIISHEISDNSSTIPTTKSVYNFVNDNKEIFYIDSFEIYTDENKPIESGLYIDINSETRFWNGKDWDYTSLEIVSEMFTTVNDNTIPTTKAVSDFVNTTESEVFYIETFENYNPSVSGIYIDYNGQTKFWNSNDWEIISYEIVDDIENAGTDMNIPTCEAIKEYIDKILNGKTITDSDTSINTTIETNTYYKYTENLTSLSLNINSGLKNVTIEFSTGSGFEYNFNVTGSFKISKQFAFEDNKNYVIAINNDLIIWSEVEEYA